MNFRFAAKRRKSKKVGHIPVPTSRGRAPAVNRDNQQNAHGPLAFRQKRNTADARPRVKDTCECRIGETHTRGRASAVSRLLLRIEGSCVSCRLLQITERARPREAGTEKMAYLDRFPPFSAALEKSFRSNPRQWPKTAGIDQASHGQWVRDADFAASPRPTQLCRTESSAIGAGLKGAGEPRSKTPSILPAPAEGASVFLNNGGQ